MLDTVAALVKALLYVGLLLSAGAVFAHTTFLRSALGKSLEVDVITSRWTRRAAALVIATSIVGAVLLLLRLGGQFDEATFAAVFSSSTGAALFMQLTGAILLISSADPSARGTRLASAILITLSFSFSGHAATVGPFEGLFVFVHASAAAWWLGSLLLLRVACDKLPPVDLAAVVRRFSLLATQIVGVLVIMGMLLIYALVGFDLLPALSNYEQRLALKLVAVVLVLALACYNKFRLTPRLLGNDATAVGPLRTMVSAELVGIVLVLVLTALLTTFTSPHEDDG